MSKQSPHTTFIVTIGYILIATLTILGIKLVYDEIVKLSEITTSTEESKELVIIGNTLVSLYKLEGTTNLAASINVEKTKSDYNALLADVTIHIDTLKRISSDSLMGYHLDSISILLDLKKKNTWQMLALLDSVEKKTIKEVSKTTILSKKNIDDLNKILINQTQSHEDTAIIKTEKKGFFKRLGDAFKSQPDSAIKISKNQIQVTDSMNIPILTDTLTQFIDELVLTNDKKNSEILQRLVARQNAMTRTNEHLTSQINKIMRDLERRELNNSIKLIQEKEETLKRSNKIVSTIGFLALGSTLLFLTLSLRALNKNTKYRRELETSKKTTEKLLVARERLILSITHDIKAPLSSIIGYLELLVRSKFPDKERYYLENMQNSAEHVLDLVKNLLDYHVLESDNQAISMMSFSPSILLDSIYKSFIPLAQTGGLILEYHSDISDKEELNYISDPYRLRQIINNLLSNAIKFTPRGGNVLLSMSTLKNNRQEILKISVKDNGPGINDEDKKTIYEEFKRFKTTTGAEGTGLGLAITHKLVNLLNGEINLLSEEGKGSEFIVTIPVQKSDVNPEKLYETSSQKTYIPKLNIGSDKKVLFIDDDMVQLNLLSELMKYEGVTPIICNDSLKALELLQREKFDIVFTDIQMPDMSGIELVERIRMGSFKNCKTVPIVALSGSSDMRERDYIDAGFSDFLPKPFTSEQLISVIQKFIGVNNMANQSTDNSVNLHTGLSTLSNFAGDDAEAGSAIIRSFIDENMQNIVVIRDAQKRNDWDTIQKVSHKMLPLMRMISANDIVDILIEFEKGNKDNDKVNILFDLLKIQLKEAEDFLSLLNNK